MFLKYSIFRALTRFTAKISEKRCSLFFQFQKDLTKLLNFFFLCQKDPMKLLTTGLPKNQESWKNLELKNLCKKPGILIKVYKKLGTL